MAFAVEFSPDAEEHLVGFSARQQRIVIDAIKTNLIHQPDVPTKQRKRLRENRFADWELRVDRIRVFYRIETSEDQKVVQIVAIGEKIRNRLVIGGWEVDL